MMATGPSHDSTSSTTRVYVLHRHTRGGELGPVVDKGETCQVQLARLKFEEKGAASIMLNMGASKSICQFDGGEKK